MKQFKTILCLIAVTALWGSLVGEPSSNSELTHTINPGNISISAPASHSLGAAQTVDLDGVDAIAETTFTVSIADLRGVNSALSVAAVVTPLTNVDSGKIRPTSAVGKNATGDTTGTITFAAATTANETTGDVTTAGFVTATAAYNRAFDFEVGVSAEAMTLVEAHTGNYVGNIQLTVE